MASEIIIASTTDSMEDIQTAAGTKPAPDAPTVTEAPQDTAPQDIKAADVSEVEPEPDPLPKPEPPKRDDTPRERKRDLQSRIDELVRDKYTSQRQANEAMGEVERLRAEMESIRRGAAPRQDPTPAPTPVEDVEPQSGDFETFEEYTKAAARWAARDERRKIEADRRAEQEWAWKQEQERRQVANEDTVRSLHFARVDAFREQTPDFDAVIDTAENIKLPPPMEAVILHEDMGPALMYYLAQHPDQCDQIARMAPGPQFVAMGKIMSQLEAQVSTGQSLSDNATAKPRASAPRRSALPPPVSTVGAGAAKSTVSLDELPYEQYREIRNREEAARMRR